MDINVRVITSGFNSFDDLKSHQILPSDVISNWSVYLYYRGMSVRTNELIKIKLNKSIFSRNMKISFGTVVERYILSQARLAMLKIPKMIPYHRAVVFLVNNNVVVDDQFDNKFEFLINEFNIGRIDRNQNIIYKKLTHKSFNDDAFVCSYNEYTQFEENKQYTSIYKD